MFCVLIQIERVWVTLGKKVFKPFAFSIWNLTVLDTHTYIHLNIQNNINAAWKKNA